MALTPEELEEINALQFRITEIRSQARDRRYAGRDELAQRLDQLAEGTIIAFEVRFRTADSTPYTYAAVKILQNWYLTQPRASNYSGRVSAPSAYATSPKSAAGLAKWLTDRFCPNVRVATDLGVLWSA